jgi:hypothetical protein
MSHWVCSICGKDTLNVDIDYLMNTDHISCLLGVWGGKDVPTNKSKLKKPMKIKGWEKISGFTYKGYSIVNPIHNADETMYEATILNLNLPQKPKWELRVLTPEHKFKGLKFDDTFSIILKDDEGRSTINSIDKVCMASIVIFRQTFEEMIDKMLGMRLTSAGVNASSHSIHSGYNKTINPNYYANNTIGGILANVNNSGTVSIYDSSTGTSINLVDTIKELQKQIEELKQNTPSNPF